MDVDFYTLTPSPHLVGVLDALHAEPGVNLRVVYERQTLPERAWGVYTGEAPSHVLNSRDLVGRGQWWDATIVDVAQESAADVVVVSTSYASLNTYALIRTLRKKKTPYVFWCERFSHISGWWVNWLRRFPVKWILHRASGLVGSTQATVDFYTRQFSFEGPTLAVPYHRDLSPFLQLPLVEDVAGPVRFLILSALVHGKGVDVVLRALAQVREPVHLDIVGDGAEAHALKELARLCPQHTIRFRGSVPYTDVAAHVRSAHVLLFPSRHDGFGMVTMEALAGGLPVVASTHVMSALEYIQPGVNGWVLPVDDVGAWTAMIQDIATVEKPRLPAYSCAARQTIREDYDAATDVRKLVRFIRGIAETSQKRSDSMRH